MEVLHRKALMHQCHVLILSWDVVCTFAIDNYVICTSLLYGMRTLGSLGLVHPTSCSLAGSDSFPVLHPALWQVQTLFSNLFRFLHLSLVWVRTPFSSPTLFELGLVPWVLCLDPLPSFWMFVHFITCIWCFPFVLSLWEHEALLSSYLPSLAMYFLCHVVEWILSCNHVVVIGVMLVDLPCYSIHFVVLTCSLTFFHLLVHLWCPSTWHGCSLVLPWHRSTGIYFSMWTWCFPIAVGFPYPPLYCPLWGIVLSHCDWIWLSIFCCPPMDLLCCLVGTYFVCLIGTYSIASLGLTCWRFVLCTFFHGFALSWFFCQGLAFILSYLRD